MVAVKKIRAQYARYLIPFGKLEILKQAQVCGIEPATPQPFALIRYPDIRGDHEPCRSAQAVDFALPVFRVKGKVKPLCLLLVDQRNTGTGIDKEVGILPIYLQLGKQYPPDLV